nr:hypothetical protein [Sedimentitalea nanhaiensis]
MAMAQGCPQAPDHAARMQDLVAQVRQAETETEARRITTQMWEMWTDAPDAVAQEMLDQGMERRAAYDFLGAITVLNRLVDYCPDYAEGYNQRAFVRFLRQDFPAALSDLDRAIALSPDHIAAIAGRALTLMGLRRMDEARIDMARALDLNPWLPERGLAAPGGPLAPRGQDI